MDRSSTPVTFGLRQDLLRRLRVVALLEQGDPAVDTEIEAFAVLADRLGAPLFRWYVPQFRGCRAAMAGRLEEAEQLSLEAENALVWRGLAADTIARNFPTPPPSSSSS